MSAKNMLLARAFEGYTLNAEARQLSYFTILDYQNTFKKFAAFIGEERPVNEIRSTDIEAFLSAQSAVSKKTVLNYHTGLSAFWTWLVKSGFAATNVVRAVEIKKPPREQINPFSQEDILALLEALTVTAPYQRPGKRATRNRLPDAERNRAIVLLLLDTGLRASEICGLRMDHFDVKNRRATITGKGAKTRTVPFSSRTGQALWRYLSSEKVDHREFVFLTKNGYPLDRNNLGDTLTTAGRRAGLGAPANPHRFRHTFAINYLRNGGDPYTLQIILGHSAMDMVRRYLAIAQADLDRVHRTASPVDHWRL